METTYAYLAGVIDVDGFISIERRRSVRRDGQVGYYVRIGFSDTSPAVPMLLRTHFLGRVFDSQPKKSTYSHFYFWEVTNRQAREPLQRLLPHLRLKRRQAEIALALMDLLEQQSTERSENGAPSAEQHAARRRLYEEVAHLNADRRRRKHRIEAPPVRLAADA